MKTRTQSDPGEQRRSVQARLERLSTSRTLGKDEIARLARTGSLIEIRKGRTLFYQDDPAERAYLVLGGAAKRTKYRSDETTLSIGVAKHGEWIGLTEVFLECPYLHDAEAVEPLLLLGLARNQLIGFLSSPSIAGYLITAISRDSYLLHSRIELNRPGSRLAAFIMRNTTSEGAALEMTQEEMAAAVGLTRETVNRHLRRLEAEGTIVLGRGQLRIVDRSALSMGHISPCTIAQRDP
jgi:CRP/FNR family transcriptional regulator, cyclic AMP receptor protein